MSKPLLEIADIFHEYGVSFLRKYVLSPLQHKVMHAIKICRTAALGGHVDACDKCGHQVVSYNSCRNRHCPKCQNLAKVEWLEARRSELLPVEYYHVVFTIPSSLSSIALQNKRVVYNILFQAASKTLLLIAADPKHLGTEIGFTTILHTWGQNLMHHPHIHCLVPGGGLSNDEEKWVCCRSGFFLPVRVLARLFRRLFLKLLEQAFEQSRLKFYDKNLHLKSLEGFDKMITSCREIEWVVYAKRPFAKPETVLDYLARYTHRIAISNHRLRRMEKGKVSFKWRDYKCGGKQKIMTLDAHEFIRRFLLHVLPHRFMRIRYYGFLANCHRTRKVRLCRRLLKVEEMVETEIICDQSWAARFEVLTGSDPLLCPHCKSGRLKQVSILLPCTVMISVLPP